MDGETEAQWGRDNHLVAGRAGINPQVCLMSGQEPPRVIWVLTGHLQRGLTLHHLTAAPPRALTAVGRSPHSLVRGATLLPPRRERSICVLSHSIREPANRVERLVSQRPEPGSPAPKALRRPGCGISVPTAADISAWTAYSIAPTFPTFITSLTFWGE